MIHSSSLDDVDALGCGDDLLGLTYSQLSDGHIAVETSVAALGGARISTQSANRSVGFRGLLGHGLTHVRLWTRQMGKISAGGVALTPGQILLVLPNQRLDVTVLGPSRSLGFTLDADAVVGAREFQPDGEVYAYRGVPRLVDSDEGLLLAFWRLARSAFWGVPPTSLAEREDWGKKLRARLMDLVGVLLSEAVPALRSPTSQLRCSRSIVQDALDFMVAHITEPLTLQELCNACGRSKRSMIYHFSDVLGITPMAYFKLQRLNAVRRALKVANPDTTRVLDIAADFGFYHIGHFAVDYRELFGVLPSMTLASSGSNRLRLPVSFA
jgi:AraC family ethanolamine operon transcriptional activator